MTTYVGQSVGGEIEPLPGENPNPELLFTERDRRNAYSLITSSKSIGSLSVHEVVSRLESIDKANNSFQARYFIDLLTNEAEGVSV